jgi:4-hydroxybenzoate polyprenyltransferase
LAVLKNLRFPQVFFHFGLFFAGMGLGFLAYPDKFTINLFSASAVLSLLIAIFCAWEASVVLNDLVDLEVDKISNNRRPLLAGIYQHKEYAQLGYAFFGLSLLGGLVVGFKFFSIMLVYQFLAWAYSAKPYRLKRFPLIATLLSAAVLILVLFAGFTLFSGDNNIQGLSWRVILLFLIALTLSLPIKDFKDIEGDKKEGIWTIPVIFGEENGRLIVATGIFISFMASVFLLNEFRLFWWAIILGALSFWIVLTKKPRQLFWWVLGTVSVYGLILVKILFS